MNDISELTARNLSLGELAERLRDHAEPGIRVLAERSPPRGCRSAASFTGDTDAIERSLTHTLRP